MCYNTRKNRQNRIATTLYGVPSRGIHTLFIKNNFLPRIYFVLPVFARVVAHFVLVVCSSSYFKLAPALSPLREYKLRYASYVFGGGVWSLLGLFEVQVEIETSYYFD